jgi:hypothetical protein
MSGARRVIGFSRRYTRERLASLLYTEVHDPGGDGLFSASETRHVVTVNLGMLQRVNILQPAVEFSLEAPASATVFECLERVSGRPGNSHAPLRPSVGTVRADAGAIRHDRFALLNVGAAWPNKRWPPDRFAAVARVLRERHGIPSLVLWGPGEQALADAVVADAPDAATAAPRTTIADVVALARAASLMVSGDTGPAHIASAVDTPIVGIYGPTRPERNGPLGTDDVWVSRAAVCQCHHLRRCRLSRMCLLDIDAAEVTAAVEKRLSRLEASSG